MIGSLRGQIISKQAPEVVIECGGVGYLVEAPMSTFFSLPAVGKDVFLSIHMVVREDAQNLYGFATEAERTLFRLLLKISGVGARMGLAILSGMSVAEFHRCVEYEDAAMLVKIPGVGKKTAQRLIIEMRDRIEPGAVLPANGVAGTGGSDARSEAFNALLSLGYKSAEITRLLGKLEGEALTAEDMIRQALRRAAN